MIYYKVTYECRRAGGTVTETEEREKEANGQATNFNIFGPSEMDWFQSVWHGVNLENNKQKVEN